MTDTAVQRKNMVESQVRPSDVSDRRITAAMRDIPREYFVPLHLADLAYIDTELTIAPGRGMTTPRDLARLLQLAEIEATDKVLVVGGGRGYTPALVAQLAADVVSLEPDAQLTAAATATLTRLRIASVTTLTGVLHAGAPEHAPFNVIFIDGAVSDVPDALVRQLAPGGRIVCVMRERGVGKAVVWRGNGASMGRRTAFEASAMPLPGLVPTVEPFAF